jgi:NADH-quinone oxidoreductase subunit J
MSAVLFFIAAAGVISGAVGVVVLRNPFYSVLALVAHLLSLAVLVGRSRQARC